MKSISKALTGALLGLTTLVVATPAVLFADVVPKSDFQERVNIPRQEVPAAKPIAAACGMNARLSGGLPIWFFDEEDTVAGGGAYMDIWDCEYPLNFRVGAEIRHMDLDQNAAAGNAEFPGKTVEITYVRIPLAVEYMTPVYDDTTLYLGVGPDIINAANDVSDTSVGMHLGARLHYAFDENWGAAVEAGYMWGEFDGNAGDIDMDGAYLTPQVSYTF